MTGRKAFQFALLSLLLCASFASNKSGRNETEEARSPFVEFAQKGSECGNKPGEEERVMCPTPAEEGHWPCIRPIDLCNGIPDCPRGEDEAPIHCLFFAVAQQERRFLARKVKELIENATNESDD